FIFDIVAFVLIEIPFVGIVFDTDRSLAVPSPEIQDIVVICADIHVIFVKDINLAVGICTRDRNVVLIGIPVIVFEIDQSFIGIQSYGHAFSGCERYAADLKIIAWLILAAVGRNVDRRSLAIGARRKCQFSAVLADS